MQIETKLLFFPFPREGGLLTLWFCGTIIGLVLIILGGFPVAGLLYLAGSLLFLSSVGTMQEVLRSWTKRRTKRVRPFIPLVLGFIVWIADIFDNFRAIIVFVFFISLLTFVSVQVIRRKEREWETRVAFAGAVLMMTITGLFISGSGYSLIVITFVFVIPLMFFSTQELFVQYIAETYKLSMGGSVMSSEFRKQVLSRRIWLYGFLFSYALASLALYFFIATSSILFPIILELFLISFPVVWLLSHGKRINFKRLGIEQASLDVLLSMTIILFLVLTG